MRQFASAGFRIWNLSREAKVVYSFFGLFSLLALASSALFYEDLVGGERGGIGAYYAGAAPPAASQQAPAAAQQNSAAPQQGPGPRIELPDAADEGAAPAPADRAPLTVAVTYRKLLEVTHFHLFTVPVFLLIVAHLFMLTGLSSRTKVAWIAGGWLSALAHLAAPWVVRYGGAGFAFLYAGSGALLGVTSLVLTGYPIWAMWLGGPPRGEARATRSADPGEPPEAAG